MKKITLAIALLLMAFGSTIAQRGATAQRKPAIKQVKVTAQTVARQPASKAYTLDFTRKGTTYNLAAGVDYSRVRVRTSKGEMLLSDLVGGNRKSSGMIIGTVGDLRNMKLNLAPKGGTIARYTCVGIKCKCTNEADCNDMFDAEVCGDIASCDTGEGTCECLKKL